MFTPTIDGTIPTRTAQWYMAIKHHKDVKEARFMTTDRVLIHAARNMAIEKMIKDDYDYVFMLDDDNPPVHTDALVSMVGHKVDIVTWPVRLRNDSTSLNICKSSIDDTWLIKYEKYKDLEWNTRLFRVYNTWCWCVLLSRKVCEDMYNKFSWRPFESKVTEYIRLNEKNSMWSQFHEIYSSILPKLADVHLDEEGKVVLYKLERSEDYLFFERAQNIGYKIWCDPYAKCEHIGKNEILHVDV